MSWHDSCRNRHVAYRLFKLFWFGSRPSAMLKKGRTAGSFQRDDVHFLRWFNDHVEDGLPRPANVVLPDQSMNCERYRGKCWYVLLPDPDCPKEKACRQICMGVVRTVGINGLTTQFKGYEFKFAIEHDPLDYNFQHCELRVFRDGVRFTKSQASALKGQEKAAWEGARKWFRTAVAQNPGSFVVVVKPLVNTGSQKIPSVSK